MNIPISLLSIITTLMLPGGVFAQCMEDDLQSPPDRGASEPYMSMHGKNMVAHGTVRALVVLVEFDYANPALDPYPNGTTAWPVHELPNWVDNVDPTYNLFEHDESAIPPQASMTRFMWDASGGDFHLVADYLSDIVTIPTTNGLAFTGFPSTVAQVCNAINQSYTTLTTHFGNNAFSDYDKWTISSSNSGLDRPPVGDSSYDHIFFIFRNALDASSGTGRASSGSPGTILTHAANSYTVFGAENAPPTKIMCHEFSHLQFGGNAFHCAGGGNTPYPHYVHQYWISQVGGWSMMGAANASLMTWSAWDRYRLGWTSDTNYSIVCRDEANLNNKNGDLDPMTPTDAGTYTLRDFVASGDAIRIKLPYTDPSKSPQYLWIENHQGRDQNGHPFDRWHYEDDSCVENLVPGLNMYMQIDREVRTSTIYSEVFAESHPTYGGFEDYLRPLDASGHYDLTYGSSIISPQCVGGETYYPFVRALPNPLTGMGDTHWNTKDRNGDGELRREHDFTLNQSELLNGVVNHHLYNLGNPRQEFTLTSNHTVLGIGTNPSSASAMNIVGGNGDGPSSKNLRRIYLNGVSVELLSQNGDGSITVQVRFDDVDVVNDTRWCADEIQLNPVATSTGYSLNVTTGNTITLDRGTTATRRNNPETFNGQQLFNSATLMRCPDQTWFNLEPNSAVVVDNGSTLRLESGSRMDVANGAVLRVKRGSTLELMGGSVLNVAPGGKVIIEEDQAAGNDGRLAYQPNARINLEGISGGAYAELEIAGLLEIADQATFTVVRAADATATHGTVRFSSSDSPSQNIIAGANSRFVLRSNNTFRQMLVVEQESLYGPPQLVEFTLRKGTAKLADNARIVPPVTNSCAINFIDARVTSTTGARNLHRGVRLNGQYLLTLSNSIFEKGTYGAYSYNSTLHTRPLLYGCTFRDCGIGMYNYDAGIQAQDCSFTGCGIGLDCAQMSIASSLKTCTAYDNGKVGISLSGSASVEIGNPDFKRNGTGLFLHGGIIGSVFCGNVSNNVKAGIHVSKNATLRMDGSPGTPHEPVTLLDNDVTILCSAANNCFLNLGYNSMKPVQAGVQKTLFGTFVCQPYAIIQPAAHNNWNGVAGVPLTTAEYSITTCGTPLTFVDPSSAEEKPCGKGVPGDPPGPHPGPHPFPMPDVLLDPLYFCPTCDDVDTDEYGTVPLNVASLLARTTAEDDSLPGNERDAIVGLNQVLMNEVQVPSSDERYLLNYNYDRLKESFSDGLMKGQLSASDSTPATDAHLALMEQVQEKRIDDAPSTDHADFRMYTRLERAQANRATGKLEAALLLLSEVDTAASAEVLELLAQIACFTQVEKDLRDSIIHWDEVELAMALCDGAAPKMMLVPETGSPAHAMALRPGLRPNPATTSVLVEELSGAECTFRIIEPAGRTVLKEVRFTGAAEVQLQGISPGIYLCRLTNAQGQAWTEKLVVHP